MPPTGEAEKMWLGCGYLPVGTGVVGGGLGDLGAGGNGVAAAGGEECVWSFVSPLGPGVTRLAPGVLARGLGGRGEVGLVAGEAGRGFSWGLPSRLICLV